MYYIYYYLRKDRTPYYIGRGKKHRACSAHKRAGGRDIRPKKNDGTVDKSRIWIVREGLGLQESMVAEKSAVRHYGRKEYGGILINIRAGGEDTAEYTAEMKKAASNRQRGRKIPKETRDKMSKAHKGRKKSRDSIEKMVKTRRKNGSYVPTEETRRLMSKISSQAWKDGKHDKTDEEWKIIAEKTLKTKRKYGTDKKTEECKRKLSSIQKNRKLAYNISTNKRYWIEKNTDFGVDEIPASLKKAIDLHNMGETRIATTGIKRTELLGLCKKYGVCGLLINSDILD